MVETNQLLRADERRELDEEERILFIKLRLQLAYPFMERTESPFESCMRCQVLYFASLPDNGRNNLLEKDNFDNKNVAHLKPTQLILGFLPSKQEGRQWRKRTKCKLQP